MRNTAANSGTSVSPSREKCSPFMSSFAGLLIVIFTGSSEYASGTAICRGSKSVSWSLVMGVTRSPLLPWTDPGRRISLLMSAVTGSSTSPESLGAMSSAMIFTRMFWVDVDSMAMVFLSNSLVLAPLSSSWAL